MIQAIIAKTVLANVYARVKPFLKYLLVVVLVLAVFLTPYYIGKADGKREYKAKAQKRAQLLREAAEEKVRQIESDSIEAADKYEQQKKVSDKQLEAYEKKYKDEKLKNTSYIYCRAGNDFLQYYRKATGYSTGAESKD